MAENVRTTGLVGNSGMKIPVRAATTANITLSGEQTIDGIACVTDDRVLVKNQTTGSENGVYVVDTGAWTRSKDFNGTYDIVSGSMIRVNEGTANGTGIFAVSTSDPITIGTTSLSFTRLTINYVVKDSQTASAGQTVVNLSAAFQTGGNSVAVYVNGLRMRLTDDYTETTSTRITFTYALNAGDEIDCYIGQAIGSFTAAAASQVSITDSADYFVATTAEGAFAELAAGIAADNGDADVTLTNASSARVQRWNTALTANRTATLSTSNAKEGAWFTVVRASGATGAFTLAVGSLATLRAPGEWATVRYDAGTAAWILEAYGILPSAEVLGMGTDVGDADATLTVGTSLRTQRWGTVLTADRTATLSTTGAYTGARFRIVRPAAATGNYALNIVAASATLARLAAGQWADVEYTGTAWISAAQGVATSHQTSVIRLHDDFLGEEVEASHWQSMIGSDAECRQGVVYADQIGGVVRLTTGDDAGATMAINGTQFQSRLNWRATQGGLELEIRLTMDAITTVAVYAGFTDQVAALEMPFTLAAGDALTSNASNAVGVLFDTAADTDNWWLVGVAADVDATKQNSALAPVAATYETWRIEVTVAGAATFYRNGTKIGSTMTGAATPSAALTPVIAVFSRAASSRNIDCDEILVQAYR